MPSTFSDSLRIELQATGENENDWGDKTNNNFELFEDAIAGVAPITVSSADVNLTTNDGSSDQARHAVLRVTGSVSTSVNVVFPDREKVYLVQGAFTGNHTVRFKNTSGTGVEIEAGEDAIIFTNGTETYNILEDYATETFVTDNSTTPDTGDIEPTFRSSAKAGWVLLQGQTLGSSSSGADLTGSTYQDLYEFIWNNIDNAYAPVSSGRGATASDDFTANKTITIPDSRGRTLFGADGSTWDVGQTQGNEEVTIAKTNLPAESLSVTGSTNTAGSHSHSAPIYFNDTGTLSAFRASVASNGQGSASTNSAGDHFHSVTGSTENMGSGTALNILPKGLGVNWMIKL